MAPDHPRADRNGYVMEHILVAEKALGHYLPSGSVIHHVNEIKDDNRSSNLVICEGVSYHKIIHVRMKILARGGNPDTEKICSKCKEIKAKSIFFVSRSTFDGLTHNCKACSTAYGARNVQRLKVQAAKYRSGQCRCAECAEAFHRYQVKCGLFAQRRRRQSRLAAVSSTEVSG